MAVAIWQCHFRIAEISFFALDYKFTTKLISNGVNSIYCSITVNHRLTGPGKNGQALPAVCGEISNTEI